MEEEFEERRKNKLNKFTQKLFHSTELKEKNLEAFHKKMKHKDDRYKEIRNKIYNKTLDNLEKSL